VKYLHYITATLFFLAAFRDWFVPGMLQISSHRSTPAEIVVEFVLGCLFCIGGAPNHFRRARRSR
jgi:hypothetical protein